MTAKNVIYDFITKPGNISLANEISEYYEQLKKDMHIKFWTTYNQQMEDKLRQSDFSPRWEFKNYDTRKIKKDWQKSSLEENLEKKDKKNYLAFMFGQSPKETDFRLMWGVVWYPKPGTSDHPGLMKLKTVLFSKNIKLQEGNWVYWGNSPYTIFDPEFLRRLYLEPDVLVSEVIDAVWSIFLEIRPLIETLDEAVNKMVSGR